ncbi:hypothetical protein CTZ28_35055 [Streptomyces shenzhenensis]|uniref:Uncharacterized protein n=1 Tax=Streptomyces shenzhenensis TaxID=943815 RepID=A0A3M0HXW3_9ACTN|nr:hypothetical protein CTZ28_35055 [Streptomyces shenzhenensis]
MPAAITTVQETIWCATVALQYVAGEQGLVDATTALQQAGEEAARVQFTRQRRARREAERRETAGFLVHTKHLCPRILIHGQ